MARCKSSPEVVRTKCELAGRLKAIRVEQYGERGGPELARRLNLPIRTWYNYETGVTVPSEVLLRFIEMTEVEPRWLLHGEGPKFRRGRPSTLDHAEPARPGTVHDLLRRALTMLESGPIAEGVPEVILPASHGSDPMLDQVVVHVEETDGEGGPARPDAFETMPLRREWISGSRRFRCVRIRGDDMAPILADGAVVGISERAEPPEALNGALVAARIGDRLLVRWFQLAGRVALLRAEQPAVEPEVVPLDGGDARDGDEPPTIRRVLWVYTPHGTAVPSPVS